MSCKSTGITCPVIEKKYIVLEVFALSIGLQNWGIVYLDCSISIFLLPMIQFYLNELREQNIFSMDKTSSIYKCIYTYIYIYIYIFFFFSYGWKLQTLNMLFNF